MKTFTESLEAFRSADNAAPTHPDCWLHRYNTVAEEVGAHPKMGEFLTEHLARNISKETTPLQCLFGTFLAGVIIGMEMEKRDV